MVCLRVIQPGTLWKVLLDVDTNSREIPVGAHFHLGTAILCLICRFK